MTRKVLAYITRQRDGATELESNLLRAKAQEKQS